MLQKLQRFHDPACAGVALQTHFETIDFYHTDLGYTIEGLIDNFISSNCSHLADYLIENFLDTLHSDFDIIVPKLLDYYLSDVPETESLSIFYKTKKHLTRLVEDKKKLLLRQSGQEE